jgi:hypothetical protein
MYRKIILTQIMLVCRSPLWRPLDGRGRTGAQHLVRPDAPPQVHQEEEQEDGLMEKPLLWSETDLAFAFLNSSQFERKKIAAERSAFLAISFGGKFRAFFSSNDFLS